MAPVPFRPDPGGGLGSPAVRRGPSATPAAGAGGLGALFAFAALLALLAAPPPVAAQADAQQDAERWSAVRDASDLVVRIDRAGLLSFLGHRHAVIPREWSARLCLTDERPPTGSGTVRMATESLVIDSDSARALAGLDDGPGEDDRREIQEKLLSERFLAAEEHPEIVLETTGLRVDDEELEVRADLTIRGVTREVTVPVAFEELDGDRLRLHGSLTVEQSDFDMEPESIAGVVNVDDEVELIFDLTAEPAGEACEPGG